MNQEEADQDVAEGVRKLTPEVSAMYCEKND